MLGVLGSFFLMAAINFMIGTCAIPLKSILALIRAKYWLIEMLSGLLIPMSFFPAARAENHGVAAVRAHRLHAAADLSRQARPRRSALRALATQWLWVVALLVLAHLWWERASRKITIHGG